MQNNEHRKGNILMHNHLAEYDGLVFRTDFEGASAGGIERLSKDWYHLNLRQDTWFWFQIKIEGAAGRKIIFQTRDNTPENERVCGFWIAHSSAEGETFCHRPWFSYDGKNWQQVEYCEADFHDKGLVRWAQTFEQDEVWMCFGIPYQTDRWREFMSPLTGHPHLKSAILGHSRLSNPVECLSITDPSVPEAEKECAWILCREDQGETCGSYALEGIIDLLLSPETASSRKKLIVNIIPMVSIDAVMNGAPFSCGYGYLTNRWLKPPFPPQVVMIKNAVEELHKRTKGIAFAAKLHGTVKWETVNFASDREEDRYRTYMFVDNAENGRMLCKYLPPKSWEFTSARTGLRPPGRFERYIHDNYNCGINFAVEFCTDSGTEARKDGQLIFKALLEKL